MSRFTTILWDVDGTLLDFEYSQRASLAKCFQTIGREITEEIQDLYDQINDSYWKRLELGEITKARLLNGRFVTLFEKLAITDVDVEAFRLEYQDGLSNIFAYTDDSLNICKALQGNIKQYVVTNGVTSIQMRKLALSGLIDVMDGLFISEQIGMPKPHKEFFDYCLDHIEERDKSRILLIGDSLTSDIKGGVRAGIPTCWYRKEGTINSSGLCPDYEISDLHQVFDILKQEL
jgi:2-haloacid dehalogenase